MRSKILMLTVITISTFLVISPPNQAYASHISWDFDPHAYGDGAVGSPPIIITVTDLSANTTAIDTIIINVNSTEDSTGIPLTLTETGNNTAIFKNTNLIFHTGDGFIPIGSTVTVTIDNISANMSSSAKDLLPVLVQSDSDVGGLMIDFEETDINSGQFRDQINFMTVMSGSFGNTLNVTEGDEITVMDTTSGLSSNGIITPNPDLGFGAILVDPAGSTVYANYQGHSASLTVDPFDLGGGGGGGVVTHPGFVLDILAAFGGGGGGADRTPPSFTLNRLSLTGLSLPDIILNSILDADPFKPRMLITDPSIEVPLRIGGNGIVPSGYSQTVETTTAETGTPVPIELTLRDESGIAHIALYTNLAGAGGEIQNSDTYIIYDKGTPVEIADPHGLFYNVTLTTSKENTKFKFLFDVTFAKPMDTSDIIFRIWDEKRNSADTKIFDAIKVVGEPLANNFVQTETTSTFIPYYKFPQYTLPIESNGNLIYYNSFGNLEQKQVHPYHEPATYPYYVGRAERHDDGFQQEIIKEDINAQRIVQSIISNPFVALEDKPEHLKFFYPSNVGKLDRENKDMLKDVMLKEHLKATKICSNLYSTNHLED